ncbi:MAG: hypothetical protein ABR927_15530 [Bacteroidales bacterium]|jgi:hypothetical protein
MTSKIKDNILKQIFVTRTHGFLDISAKRELFSEISKLFSGDFTIKHTVSYDGEILNISIPYKNWRIEITESDNRPLKFQVSFDSLQDFELIISWKDIFDKILKKIGKPEIEVGRKDFDDHFVINSNKSDLAIQLISEEIQNYLLKYNVYSISITNDRNFKKTNLLCVISRTLDDKKSYEDMIILHQLFIDQLDREKIIK